MKRYTVLNKPKQKSTYQFVCVIKSHTQTEKLNAYRYNEYLPWVIWFLEGFNTVWDWLTAELCGIPTLQAPGCQSESVCAYPGQLDLESRSRNILELSWLLVVAVTPGLRGSDGSHAVSTGSRRGILRRLSRILTLAGSWLPGFPSFLPIFLSLLSLCCYELCKVLLISPLSV